MEKKKCSTCGRLLPIDRFLTWVRKDGSLGSLHQCLQCQRNNANKRYRSKKILGEVSRFDTEVLISELARRGIMVSNTATSD